MFGNFLKFGKKKKFLGIDIGSFNIKIIELGKSGKNISLENYGGLGVFNPEENSFRVFEKDTLLLSDYDLARAIKAICEQAKIQTKDANFSIPDFSSFFTNLQLPIMNKDEIGQAINYEIRPYIPIPISEITLDWVITEGTLGKTPVKILAVAVPNSIINQYKEVAKLAKLNLKIVEPEVFALARGLREMTKLSDSQKIIALIDIGAKSTTCSILEQRVLKTSNSFSIGFNFLIESLQRTLDIDYNGAEALYFKFEKKQEIKQEEQFSAVSKIIDIFLDEVAEEIKMSFRNFSGKEAKDIDKIILSGGLASLQGQKERFIKEFNKEIIIANPFLGISFDPILTESLKTMGPSYAIATGLALKGLE